MIVTYIYSAYWGKSFEVYFNKRPYSLRNLAQLWSENIPCNANLWYVPGTVQPEDLD